MQYLFSENLFSECTVFVQLCLRRLPLLKGRQENNLGK